MSLPGTNISLRPVHRLELLYVVFWTQTVGPKKLLCDVLLVVVISSLKIPKAFLIRSVLRKPWIIYKLINGSWSVITERRITVPDAGSWHWNVSDMRAIAPLCHVTRQVPVLSVVCSRDHTLSATLGISDVRSLRPPLSLSLFNVDRTKRSLTSVHQH